MEDTAISLGLHPSNKSMDNHDCDQSRPEKDYSIYLTEREIAYKVILPYLLVGRHEREEGFLIHISIVRQQMPGLIGPLLDFLQLTNLSYVIPKDADYHGHILDGGSGLLAVGKIITVYVSSGQKAAELSPKLIKLTQSFKGPAVPTAVRLGNCIYVSWGALFPDKQQFDHNCYSAIYGFAAEEALNGYLRKYDLQWPFYEFSQPKNKKRKRLINSQYLPIQSLKHDPKGKVLKCIKINRGYNMQWCILKQGKQHQCFDDEGRDIKDRLWWQYEIHTLLAGKVPLPRVIEYFESDGDAYLALEFIDGIPLSEKITNLCQGIIWKNIGLDLKREIIEYLLQVITILERLHENKLIHRDINPGNFLVTAEKLVFVIDVELSYNSSEKEPAIPFALGTIGYISPQQLSLSPPEQTDDIYGLGALLVKVFTSLSPSKICTGNAFALQRALQFFIDYNPLAEIIAGSLEGRGSMRPGIGSIRRTLETYTTRLENCGLERPTENELPINENPSFLTTYEIQQAINGLFGHTIKQDQLWASKIDTEGVLANEISDCHWQPGFYAGASGVLLLLSLAKRLGYDVDRYRKPLYANAAVLETAAKNFNNLTAGLYTGACGIAIGLSALINSKLSEDTQNKKELIDFLIDQPTNEINIANGKAGKGLCLLLYANDNQPGKYRNQLLDIVSHIIGQQERDGSWTFKKDETKVNGVKLTGFSYGVAGISYFLLEYYYRFGNVQAKIALMKSLAWLLNHRKLINGHWLWTLNDRIPTIDPWLDYGFSGIALTFIKAFEILGDVIYKEAATSALLSHPKYISSNYFSFGNGLSGLGEIYLEAYKVFRENEWKERADHIVNFLMRSCSIVDNSIFWLDGNDTFSVAGLMDGNAGIIHLLMRAVSPEDIAFPFHLNR